MPRTADRPSQAAVRRPARCSSRLSVVSPGWPSASARLRAMHEVEIVLLPAGAGRRADGAGTADLGSLPDPDDAGRTVAGPDPRPVPGASGLAGAGARLPALPAADPLLGRVLHLAARVKANARPIGLLAVGWCWSRRWRSGSSSIRWCHPWAGPRPSPWAPSSRRQMPCLPPPLPSDSGCRAACHDPGGREPRQRRHRAGGARAAIVRGGRHRAFSLQGATVTRSTSASAGWRSAWSSAGPWCRSAKRLSDPPVAVLVSLLAPFAAWIPGRAAAVLRRAVGRHGRDRARPCRARILTSDTRVLASGVWQMVIFVLNGLVFILIGLQLPTILGELRATWTPRAARDPRRRRQPDRDRGAHGLGLPRHVPAALARSRPEGAGPVTAAADRGDPGLGRHAGGRLAGRRAGACR